MPCSQVMDWTGSTALRPTRDLRTVKYRSSIYKILLHVTGFTSPVTVSEPSDMKQNVIDRTCELLK